MLEKKELWFDARKLTAEEEKVLLPLATNNGYEGVMINVKQSGLIKAIPKQVRVLVYVEDKQQEELKALLASTDRKDITVFASDEKLLSKINGVDKGLFLSVNDRESLDKTVEMTNHYSNVIIEFLSATNIPLELVLAFSQKNKCHVCKKVTAGEDGWIASMVMEMGSHSVLLETKRPNDIVEMREKMDSLETKKMDLKELTVIGSKHIGMGDRVCIDTTSQLKEDEGLILGSTSTGGILVSSETHYLPYMELRPFRVNAGGVHLYAWNMDDKTDYLSELKGGSPMMAVDSKGNVRRVAVGRIKMERRPLILIRAKDDAGSEVNVVLQDDWHVRVIGPKGKPLNCTELKAGDKVLGYTCVSGRHVGIKIDENIIEK